MNQTKSTIVIQTIVQTIPTVKLFSDGSIHVNINLEQIPLNTPIIEIYANLKDTIGLLALPSIVALLRSRCPNALYHLHMPFIPCGRQDRVTGEGFELNAFTLKHTVAPLINICKFDLIKVVDAHSSVSGAVFDTPKYLDVSQDECLKEMVDANLIIPSNYDFIVSPDAGAYKKIFNCAKILGTPIVEASKIRDLLSNKIIKTSVNTSKNELEGKRVILCDDIAEYATTARDLAKVLKEDYGVKTVDLFITHGIFPVNERLVTHSRYNFPLEFLDNIYTYYLWNLSTHEEKNPNIINLYSF